MPEQAALPLALELPAVLFPLPSLHQPRQTCQLYWDLHPLYSFYAFPANTARLAAGDPVWLHN